MMMMMMRNPSPRGPSICGTPCKMVCHHNDHINGFGIVIYKPADRLADVTMSIVHVQFIVVISTGDWRLSIYHPDPNLPVSGISKRTSFVSVGGPYRSLVVSLGRLADVKIHMCLSSVSGYRPLIYQRPEP